MGFKLVSESNGQVYALPDGATLVVGRGAGCDVMVANPNISRRHAQVRVVKDSIELKDLGSANGTFVNGDRASESTARPGDVITFGTAAFRLEKVANGDGTAARAVAAGSSAGGRTTEPPVVKPGAAGPAPTPKKLAGTHVRPIAGGDVGTLVTRLSATAEPESDDVSRTAPRSLRRQLDAMLAVAARLLRERDVSGIMSRVAEHAIELLSADRMAVLLLDKSGTLVQAVSRTTDGGAVERMVPQSIARRALEEKVAILTDDAGEDSRFSGESVRKQLVRSAICVPLFADGIPLGVLYVDSITASKAFGADDLELTMAFAGIVAAAVERERLGDQLRREAVVRSSFERYFAPALAQRIASAPENVRLGGERRTVAVLFSDIRGFSAWSEKLPAEETARILSEYFGEMVECVFATGGTLDKFIGDALMAQWGAPLSTGTDAVNALKTARLMHEKLGKLNEKWKGEGRPVLQVGIGIGYGDVFAGNIGSARRLEYTVIGDVVNVASRLASLAAPEEVLISGDARDAMGSVLPDAEELEQLASVAGLETCGYSEYISPGMGDTLPAGYEPVDLPQCRGVIRTDVASDVLPFLVGGTFYDYARRRGDSTGHRGRATAYAFAGTASGIHILVRRSTHGGILAPLTREYFMGNGRAPRELQVARVLNERAVPTPEVLGYLAYPVAPGLSRVDVLVSFLPDSRDLAALLATVTDPVVRAAALEAAARLLQSLAAARVFHPDLNMRNILIAAQGQAQRAYVLDVDRVVLDAFGVEEVARRNSGRLLRSARKLAEREGLKVSVNEMTLLSRGAANA